MKFLQYTNRNINIVTPLPVASPHALAQKGVTPGLADDESGPLQDNDADEEGRVAGVLQHLSVVVGLGGRVKT